ncbi:hypothetical protein [Streptomyces niveus]|uniref:hypothetical protein n=1 Tax=Streptomyces niveus TaxID=193462 RepID=UPI003652EF26
MIDFNLPPQRTAQKEDAAQAAFVAGFVAVVVFLLLLPLQGWLLMLVFGALHGAFAAVPAVGYGTSVLFVVGADILAFTAKKFRK